MTLYCLSTSPALPLQVVAHHINLEKILPFLAEDEHHLILTVNVEGQIHHLAIRWEDLPATKQTLQDLDLDASHLLSNPVFHKPIPAERIHGLPLTTQPTLLIPYREIPLYQFDPKSMDGCSLTEKICLTPHLVPEKELALTYLSKQIRTPRNAWWLVRAFQYPHLNETTEKLLLHMLTSSSETFKAFIKQKHSLSPRHQQLLSQHFHPLVFKDDA